MPAWVPTPGLSVIVRREQDRESGIDQRGYGRIAFHGDQLVESSGRLLQRFDQLRIVHRMALTVAEKRRTQLQGLADRAEDHWTSGTSKVMPWSEVNAELLATHSTRPTNLASAMAPAAAPVGG